LLCKCDCSDTRSNLFLTFQLTFQTGRAINESLYRMVHISPTLCFSIAAVAWANHHESLSLSPAEHSVVRYTNESLIVQCRSPDPKVVLHWKSPKGEIIREHKGRIHIEQTSAGKDRMGLWGYRGFGLE